MSKREEWFRNDRWDEAERAEFFRRLNRCKVFYRVQNLGQKALVLQKSGGPAKLDAALELYLRSGREADEAAGKPEEMAHADFYRQWALNAQASAGDVRAAQARVEEAIAHYREACRREGGVPGPYIVRWAEVLHRARRVADYPEMLDLLHSAFARDGERVYAIYRRTTFLFGYYQAVFSSALGRTEAARAYARAARAVMDMPDHGIGQSLSLGTAEVTAEEASNLTRVLGEADGQ